MLAVLYLVGKTKSEISLWDENLARTSRISSCVRTGQLAFARSRISFPGQAGADGRKRQLVTPIPALHIAGCNLNRQKKLMVK